MSSALPTRRAARSWRRRAGVWVTTCVGAVLAAGGCTNSGPREPAEVTTPPRASSPVAYANQVLDILATGLTIGPGWPDVRADVERRAGHMSTDAQTYDALRDALAGAGQSRADFIAPGDPTRVPATSAVPTADTTAGVTVVTLPGFVDLSAFPGTGPATEAEKAYARGGSAAIANASKTTTCGWVVDVRGNSSTDVPALVGAVASLLPLGPAVTLKDKTGAVTALDVTDDSLVIGRTTALPLDPVTRLDGPVVVLQNGGTVRAGEAVALAFRGRAKTHSIGGATFGEATNGTVEPLSDGARMYVERWRMGDRDNSFASGPIAPDETVAGGTAQLTAARTWLATQCGGAKN